MKCAVAAVLFLAACSGSKTRSAPMDLDPAPADGLVLGFVAHDMTTDPEDLASSPGDMSVVGDMTTPADMSQPRDLTPGPDLWMCTVNGQDCGGNDQTCCSKGCSYFSVAGMNAPLCCTKPGGSCLVDSDCCSGVDYGGVGCKYAGKCVSGTCNTCVP